MKHKKGRKLLSLMLAVAMVIGMIPMISLTASAKVVCPICGNYEGKTDPNTFYDFTEIDGTYICMNNAVHGDEGYEFSADQAGHVRRRRRRGFCARRDLGSALLDRHRDQISDQRVC